MKAAITLLPILGITVVASLHPILLMLWAPIFVYILVKEWPKTW